MKQMEEMSDNGPTDSVIQQFNPTMNFLEMNQTSATKEENKQLTYKDTKVRESLMKEYHQVMVNPKSTSDRITRLFDCIDKYAIETPNRLALREYNTGEDVTWSEFQLATKAIAAKLLSLGTFQKGDIVVTQLPLLKEHLYIMYACWRLGLIVVPIDLRLKDSEVSQCLDKLLGTSPSSESKGNGKVKMVVFLGKTPIADFRPIIDQVMRRFKDKIPYWIQFQKEKELIMPQATGITDFLSDAKSCYIFNRVKELSLGLLLPVTTVASMENQCTGRTPCLIIFTTGSTGMPKAAILCNENILIQNLATKVAFSNILENSRDLTMLCNLPASHVGCITEQVLTGLYGGGCLVLLHVFDAEKSLDAIQKYKVNMLGQIPALFQMQWALPSFSKYDLSSVKMVIYGGQSVTTAFLHKMKNMGPYIGSGLGLTELAGFCTYTPVGVTVEEMGQSIGFDAPVCPLTIREPPKKVTCPKTGKVYTIAGDVKKSGEVGEICHSGPQIFLGYLNDPTITSETIIPLDLETARDIDYSKILNYDIADGSMNGKGTAGVVGQKKPIKFENLILYTGDVGSYDDSGLHFASRRKFIMKPKGYQVFPSEVEEHLEQHFKKLGATKSLMEGKLWDKVKGVKDNESVISRIGCISVDHPIYSEAVVAVIELRKDLTQLITEHYNGSKLPQNWYNDILTEKEVHEASKEIAAYKRPTYVVFIPPSMDIPLTRTAKIDYLALKEFAKQETAKINMKYSSL